MNAHSLTFSCCKPTLVGLVPSSSSSSSSSSFQCRAAVATPQKNHIATRRLSPGSLYDVLHVKPDASNVEIKNAYRSLAKLYHPDVTQSLQQDGCEFIDIHNAYETLSDPASRAVYDLSLGLDFGSSVRLTASSFQGYSSGCQVPTRKWETDQCW